jgi:hypothetical protein
LQSNVRRPIGSTYDHASECIVSNATRTGILTVSKQLYLNEHNHFVGSF